MTLTRRGVAAIMASLGEVLAGAMLTGASRLRSPAQAIMHWAIGVSCCCSRGRGRLRLPAHQQLQRQQHDQGQRQWLDFRWAVSHIDELTPDPGSLSPAGTSAACAIALTAVAVSALLLTTVTVVTRLALTTMALTTLALTTMTVTTRAVAIAPPPVGAAIGVASPG